MANKEGWMEGDSDYSTNRGKSCLGRYPARSHFYSHFLVENWGTLPHIEEPGKQGWRSGKYSQVEHPCTQEDKENKCKCARKRVRHSYPFSFSFFPFLLHSVNFFHLLTLVWVSFLSYSFKCYFLYDINACLVLLQFLSLTLPAAFASVYFHIISFSVSCYRPKVNLCTFLEL